MKKKVSKPSGAAGKSGKASSKTSTGKPAKAAPVKSKAAAEPAKGAAQPKSTKPADSGAKATKPTAKASAAKNAAQPKPTKPSSAAGKPTMPAPKPARRAEPQGNFDVTPSDRPEPVSAGDLILPKSKPGAESDDAMRGDLGLDKVMASLGQIFSGKDFLSDAELDALLDSKMASGEIPPSMALDPLDEAQSIVYEAWNSEGPEKIELAHRALDVSPDCADAYVILAQAEAKSQEAALPLWRKGVEAGKRALDPGLFAKSMGKFWELMETRPYMRARLGLAECLWELGKRDEALEHLRDLIRLNSGDDQGVRYILIQCLLESGADARGNAEGELGELLDRYQDDKSPEIQFTRALWMFRREGRSALANAQLAAAKRANPFVADYLAKRKPLPKRLPDAAAAGVEGSEAQAQAYADGAAETWHDTLGALDWLSAQRP